MKLPVEDVRASWTRKWFRFDAFQYQRYVWLDNVYHTIRASGFVQKLGQIAELRFHTSQRNANIANRTHPSIESLATSCSAINANRAFHIEVFKYSNKFFHRRSKHLLFFSSVSNDAFDWSVNYRTNVAMQSWSLLFYFLFYLLENLSHQHQKAFVADGLVIHFWISPKVILICKC